MLQVSCCNCTKAQSVDALRVQARNALLEGAQSGKLMEATSQSVVSQMDFFFLNLLRANVEERWQGHVLEAV